MVATRITQQQQREQSPPASTFKWQQAENFFEAETPFRPISLVQQIVAQRQGTQELCLPSPPTRTLPALGKLSAKFSLKTI